MQRRHYYEQPYSSESIPLESPYNNRGPSPSRYPDQQNSHAYSDNYQDPNHYGREGPANPFSNSNYNPELSSPHYPDQQQYHRDDYSHGQPSQAHSNITPGADNFSNAAAGGVAGIAYSVADGHARESDPGAMRHAAYPAPGAYGNNGQAYAQAGPGPYETVRPSNSSAHQNPFSGGSDGSSRSSVTGYGPGHAAGAASSYPNDPYQTHPRAVNPQLGVVDPAAIADDGDDGIDYGRPAPPALSLHSNASAQGRNGLGVGAGAGAAAAVGAGAVGLSSERGSNRNSAAGVFYDGSGAAAGGGGGGRAAAILEEKESQWMKKHSSGKKKWRWAIIIGVVTVILAAVIGGVLGSVLKNKDGGSSANKGQSADEDTAENGDLGINSAEIKKLMSNSALHKVFPGMDYTPNNAQYPDCLKFPPSQNNITRDMAVLSQLTDTVRLYGTDCNQTQMVVHAIERLELKDTMKIWLGVWQDKNTTTNARQLKQMWDILDEYGDEPFAGLIIANEILFREEMTITELGSLLSKTRKQLADKGLNLPVATSDLGDDLTQALVDESDYVMANIHPFFAGVTAKTAASWTYSFWKGTNGPLWKTDTSKNIIAEIGWPTSGGTNTGSVASVEGANQLLEDWVCDALTNGTNYFWFSAFDEPWKARFNEPGKEWEDQWGLFDVNRNLKKGITIPDCGGKTI
ncbi:related to glucan 1,3-beta-glucosidase precursor [Cephalotrichum gorgonifer]|uniref:glucan endo-1,3-beta-D-glucosidase n=1 Tax=Cephalotrichum gorgonifer TaxID=2041049 RepID=A0AAE8N8X2_9PEZI|nr:related to glucan 1,3-beta-glucosidase precursor [Cephalotrichum gorgonifer]